MKPNKDDLIFIKNYEKNYTLLSQQTNNGNFIEIPDFIYDYFEKRKKIVSVFDDRTLKIKKILDKIKDKKISCRKLYELCKKSLN